MSTKRERNPVKEQLRRARSAAHLARRIRNASSPRSKFNAYIDFITAYMAHATPEDQTTVANRIRTIAEDLKRGR